MLCPNRLRAGNYCGMYELERMDQAEITKMQREQDKLARKVYIPIHFLNFGTKFILMSLVGGIIADNIALNFKLVVFYKNFQGIIANGTVKHISLCIIGVVGMEIICFISYKILFRKINLDKGSWYFHDKRVSRLRRKVVYINNLHPKNMSPLKGRYVDELKAHFTEVSRKYRQVNHPRRG